MPPTAQSTIGQLDEATEAVRGRTALQPKIGLVLGSGLGTMADRLENAARIPYGDIPHMPGTAVSGHAGNLCIGSVAGGPVVACLQGRAHLYEGHPLDKIVFGARLLARLGCTTVLLTNAAGGIATSFSPGTLMLIDDHINLTGRNPLFGPNLEALGPRFPDMTRAYDAQLAALATSSAAELEIDLKRGVYAAVLGPSYETPAEIAMLRTIGADAVGMSTVPEVIALRHMGVRVAAVSCITNMAAGMTSGTLDHSEVEQTAAKVRESFIKLLSAWINAIATQE